MTSNKISYNWSNLPKEIVFEKYVEELLEMKKYAKRHHISEKEINQLFHECFHNDIKKCSLFKNCFSAVYALVKYITIFISVIVVLYLFIIHHTPTSSFIIRNAQGWIYPGFRIWRKLSLPIVKYFPSLTELYDESCLVRNPLMQTSLNDCWSCEQIKMIPDMSSINLKNILEYGRPYFVKSDQAEVSTIDLRNFYNNNKKTFLRDAPRIYSSNNSIQNLDEMMNSLKVTLEMDVNYLWRINRMSAGRVLRELFPRPYVIPNLGQSTERFIMILGPNAPLAKLPDTDCFNVFLLQVYGHRNIVLKPPSQCKLCKPVAVIMKPSYVLVFNWLHYKAVSLPNEINNSESISFIGSYC